VLFLVVSLGSISSWASADRDGLDEELEIEEIEVGGERHPAAAGELIIKRKDDDKFQVVKLSRGKSILEAEAEFERDENIEYVEPNYIAYAFFVPNDPYYPFQWHLNNPVYGGIKTAAAWDVSTGSNVVVAVIDTGIAYENYLEPSGKRFYRAPDFSGSCFVSGYDFVNKDTHANDDNSHGTHVAGTVAQRTNNTLGVAGVAFNSCLMPVKVLNKFGSGTYANVAAGIRFAADNGAKVINLSLGGSASSQTLLDAVAYAYNKGVTIVAAAGNDGTNVVSYPAAYDDYAIAVGATRFDETLAYYSNFGNSLDLVAPGGDLTVDQNGDGYADGVLQNTFNPNTKNTSDFGYWFFQGTSMATPHVAGTAALVIAKGTATTPTQVRTALESTAEDLGAPGLDSVYGRGLVDAASALAWTGTPSPPPASNQPPVANAGPDQVANEGSAVSFDGSLSSDPDGTIVSFAWNFGDGATASGLTVSHPYADNGIYTVTLTVTDNNGATASDTALVTVNNVAPIANAGGPYNGSVNQPVTMTGSATDPGVLDAHTFVWNFGDNSSATGQTVSHTYTVLGTYPVSLTVTDKDGGVGTSTTSANITPAPSLNIVITSITARDTSPGEEYNPKVYVLNNESSSYTVTVHPEIYDPNGQLVAWGGLADKVITVNPKAEVRDSWQGTVPSGAITGTYLAKVSVLYGGSVLHSAQTTFLVSAATPDSD
jgi:serine protease